MFTYLKSIDKFLEIDHAITVLIKILEDLSCLIFGDLNAEVHKTPPEVVHVQVAVAFNVHSFENSLKTSDTESRSVKDLSTELLNKVCNIKLAQVFNSPSITWIWGCLEKENIVILLELGWNVRSKSTLSLKCQVLRSVFS